MKIQKKILSIAVLCALAALATGCSSTASRIQKNQQYFDTLPADAQANIRAGKVDIGYTPEMVQIAIGEPSRRYTRTTERGSSEVWAYASKAPALSIGIGVGGGGGHTAVGTGVGVTTGGDRSDDKIRVIFEGGKVTSVEQSK